MRCQLALLLTARIAVADAPVLSQGEMQEVLRALQRDFVQPEAVNYESLNRAAIEGLLQRNPQTMQLAMQPVAGPVPPPAVESLTARIAAVRPQALRREDAAALREPLTKLAAGETAALILDLRAKAADSDPVAAADWAGLFLPKGTPLPGGVKTVVDAAWTRELVVLVDGDTTNTGEVVAALLQSGRRALLAGAATRGRTAAVVELPLRKTDEGVLVLRYAAQRVVFPEGTPDPFSKGLVPDMPVPQDADKEKVFALQAREGLARAVFHPARPRTNEAALAAKTNPELPERIARSAGKPSAYDAPLTDRPLQLAVDVLTARAVLKPEENR